MLVNLISESEFAAKDQGVHTAYINYAQMIESTGNHVIKNSLGRADITHLHTFGPFALFKLLTNKPTVITAHVIPASFVGSLVGAKYWLGISNVFLKFVYNKANLVLAVSPKVKDELIKMGVKNVELFPNPINLQRFKKDTDLGNKEREKLGIKDDEFVILGAGQIQTRKGVADFIETAKKLPELKFVWIGGQPFKQLTEIDEKLKKDLSSPPSNLLLAGVFKYDEMPSIYNVADVFFLPSYQENAPMSILEAGASSLPLILRDLAEYKLLYDKGYVGANEKNFAEEIKKLYEDKKYYEDKQKEALDLVNNFSFEILGKKLIALYNNLLQK